MQSELFLENVEVDFQQAQLFAQGLCMLWTGRQNQNITSKYKDINSIVALNLPGILQSTLETKQKVEIPHTCLIYIMPSLST
jgi:hypothetical protein